MGSSAAQERRTAAVRMGERPHPVYARYEEVAAHYYVSPGSISSGAWSMCHFKRHRFGRSVRIAWANVDLHDQLVARKGYCNGECQNYE